MAIKFWIIIVNLQYHDVKKLSLNEQDRELVNQVNEECGSDFKIMHTSLPVDLVVYERIVPLFQKALGSLADRDFKAA